MGDDDVAALIRDHLQAALAAAADGRLDEARAHWEAHQELMAVTDPAARPALGVDRKELENLARLLEAVEVESEDDGQGTASATPPGLDGSPVPVPPTPVERVKAPKPERPTRAWLREQVREILVEFGEDRAVKLPASFLKDVERAALDFTVRRRRGWYGRALERMDKYLPTIHGIFSERRLPESLYYLALVESAFDPNARSRAGAVGLWQFMPQTARRYGLTVRRGLDERRDPAKATEAAREYLLDLILEFGDGQAMLLAMAAYNAGEGRVRNRLRRLDDFRNRNFWTLSERQMLPAETRKYVPTIIAAAVVGRNRDRFGFGVPVTDEPLMTLSLYRPVSVPYLLRVSNMAESALLALNPDLQRGTSVTPADTRFQLILPAAIAERLASDPVIRTALRPPRARATRTPKKKVRVLAYRVQRNDSWWRISRWSGVSQADLRSDNPRATKAGLRPGQTVYIRGVSKDVRRFYHAIEPGESVSTIAKLYRVASQDILHWNGLMTSRVRVGKRLVIYARMTDAAVADLRARLARRAKASPNK